MRGHTHTAGRRTAYEARTKSIGFLGYMMSIRFNLPTLLCSALLVGACSVDVDRSFEDEEDASIDGEDDDFVDDDDEEQDEDQGDELGEDDPIDTTSKKGADSGTRKKKKPDAGTRADGGHDGGIHGATGSSPLDLTDMDSGLVANPVTPLVPGGDLDPDGPGSGSDLTQPTITDVKAPGSGTLPSTGGGGGNLSASPSNDLGASGRQLPPEDSGTPAATSNVAAPNGAPSPSPVEQPKPELPSGDDGATTQPSSADSTPETSASTAQSERSRPTGPALDTTTPAGPPTPAPSDACAGLRGPAYGLEFVTTEGCTTECHGVKPGIPTFESAEAIFGLRDRVYIRTVDPTASPMPPPPAGRLPAHKTAKLQLWIGCNR